MIFSTRIMLLVVVAATASIGTVAGTASASGPAPPGKELVQISCDGLAPFTVAVQRGDNANGAGQIVDMKGHGIPVENTFTLTDLTTSTVVDTEVTTSGQNGHSNQPATHCSGVLLEGSASDFFGTDLPAGVAPNDTVQLALDALVVIKL
jgi:hypothetical protein